MLTVLESIKLSTEYLEKKGIESPRTNAELLLADIIGCKRLDLYLKFDRPISEKERVQYRDYISRRSKFEPLQYILGYTEFYGHKFYVNSSVLIPRPETEILIEKIIKDYPKDTELDILDIGTGSGNIAICLAKHFENAKVTTIDISEEAIGIAKTNSELHEVAGRITCGVRNVLEISNHKTGNGFDIIVSNPPYVDEEQYRTLQKEITDYEPKNAVTDMSDGYKFYEHISMIHSQMLKEKGRIYFEVGIGQSEKVKQIMDSSNLANIDSVKDYLDIERVIYGEKK